MAIIISGKTLCSKCGKVIRATDPVIGFPAFLPCQHPLADFSDAAFHADCAQKCVFFFKVEQLYARFRAVMDTRPRDLKTLEEMDEWARENLLELWNEPDFSETVLGKGQASND